MKNSKNLTSIIKHLSYFVLTLLCLTACKKTKDMLDEEELKKEMLKYDEVLKLLMNQGTYTQKNEDLVKKATLLKTEIGASKNKQEVKLVYPKIIKFLKEEIKTIEAITTAVRPALEKALQTLATKIKDQTGLQEAIDILFKIKDANEEIDPNLQDNTENSQNSQNTQNTQNMQDNKVKNDEVDRGLADIPMKTITGLVPESSKKFVSNVSQHAKQDSWIVNEFTEKSTNKDQLTDEQRNELVTKLIIKAKKYRYNLDLGFKVYEDLEESINEILQEKKNQIKEDQKKKLNHALSFLAETKKIFEQKVNEGCDSLYKDLSNAKSGDKLPDNIKAIYPKLKKDGKGFLEREKPLRELLEAFIGLKPHKGYFHKSGEMKRTFCRKLIYTIKYTLRLSPYMYENKLTSDALIGLQNHSNTRP